MREENAVALGAAAVCALALVSGISPEADDVAGAVVVGLLGLGVLAGIACWRVHIRRIRRDIEAGRGMVMRKDHGEPSRPRPPVCGRAQRGRRRRPARCRPGRTRYR